MFIISLDSVELGFANSLSGKKNCLPALLYNVWFEWRTAGGNTPPPSPSLGSRVIDGHGPGADGVLER